MAVIETRMHSWAYSQLRSCKDGARSQVREAWLVCPARGSRGPLAAQLALQLAVQLLRNNQKASAVFPHSEVALMLRDHTNPGFLTIGVRTRDVEGVRRSHSLAHPFETEIMTSVDTLRDTTPALWILMTFSPAFPAGVWGKNGSLQGD